MTGINRWSVLLGAVAVTASTVMCSSGDHSSNEQAGAGTAGQSGAAGSAAGAGASGAHQGGGSGHSGAGSAGSAASSSAGASGSSTGGAGSAGAANSAGDTGESGAGGAGGATNPDCIAASSIGKDIYFSRVSPPEIFRIAANTGVVTKIADGSHPVPNSTGTALLLLRGGDVTYHGSLYRRRLSDGNEATIYTNTDNLVGGDFLHGDDKVIFDWACSVYTADQDGKNVAQFSAATCYDDAPNVNAVTLQIAVQNINDGIYVMDSDGMNRKLLPNTAPNDVWPIWSVDGKKLLYQHVSRYDGVPASVELFVIGADGNGRVSLGTLDKAFGAASFAQGGTRALAGGTRNGTSDIWAFQTNGASVLGRLCVPEGSDIDAVAAVD